MTDAGDHEYDEEQILGSSTWAQFSQRGGSHRLTHGKSHSPLPIFCSVFSCFRSSNLPLILVYALLFVSVSFYRAMVFYPNMGFHLVV